MLGPRTFSRAVANPFLMSLTVPGATEPSDAGGWPPVPTDASLIARSRRDPEAFAALFDRHWAAIHGFCTARAGSAGEDIAAEVFRTAFHRRGAYDLAHGQARPWLYGIATNLLREHFRAGQRRDRAMARAAAASAGRHGDEPLGRMEARLLGPELAAALGALPAADRDALLLLAWAELSYEEIARVFGVPLGTVRSRINRARRRIHEHLETEHR
jgi:RNA polymerase sigma factor (sigma-70 family)